MTTGPASGCNMMRRIGGNDCICSGDRIVYECSLSGPGSTVWSGTLFRCPAQQNEIFFLHSRFDGLTKYCNITNRSLAAHAVKRENNCFTSLLNFSADPSMNNSTAMCIHDNEMDSITIASQTLIVITGKITLEYIHNPPVVLYSWKFSPGENFCQFCHLFSLVKF